VLHRLLLVEVANFKFVTVLCCLTGGLLLRGFTRRRGRAIVVVAGSLAALLAVADGVNTHYGYLPQVADVVGAVDWPTVPLQDAVHASPVPTPPVSRAILRAGGIVNLPVDGVVSGFGRHDVLIDLPPQYFTEPTARFPVVYLLHGSPGRPEDWLRAARLLQTGRAIDAVRPMIFVMPPMSRGWLDDSECVNSRRERIETWLVADVLPTVDRLLRTTAKREDRAVVGMSAGGYCALNLAIRDSALFGAAFDMSGYTGPTYDGGLHRLFGADWSAQAAQNMPAQYVSSHHVTLPLRIRFDAGAQDPRPLREIGALLPTLRNHRIDTTVVTRSGGHTYHVWVPALREGLAWLATVFPAVATATTVRGVTDRPVS